MKCTFCNKEINIADRVARTDVCPRCGRDLRCCKQCSFYDPHAYNECKEVSAERITDKERANFCDYFVMMGSRQGTVGRTNNARKALEALFKK